MKLRLALYDPSYYDAEGSNWTWKNPEIPGPILDRFFYDVAGKRRPSNPKTLTPSKLNGGLSRMGAGWSVVYRFCDGGRDRHGRPGRFVIVCAWFITGEVAALGVSDLLCSPVFADVVAAAPTSCPIPSPSNLTIEWRAATMKAIDPVDLERLLSDRRKAFSGENAWTKAEALFFSIPPGRPTHLCLLGDDTTQRAEITISSPESVKSPALQNSLHPHRQTSGTSPEKKKSSPSPGKLRLALNTLWSNGPMAFAAGILFGLLIAVILGWRPDFKFLPLTEPLRSTTVPKDEDSGKDDENDKDAKEDVPDVSKTVWTLQMGRRGPGAAHSAAAGSDRTHASYGVCRLSRA